jgi:hypothetical protein
MIGAPHRSLRTFKNDEHGPPSSVLGNDVARIIFAKTGTARGRWVRAGTNERDWLFTPVDAGDDLRKLECGCHRQSGLPRSARNAGLTQYLVTDPARWLRRATGNPPTRGTMLQRARAGAIAGTDRTVRAMME